MLNLPVHVDRPGRPPTRHRTWDVEGWSQLDQSLPGTSRGELLSALLAVLTHRYGTPCRLTAGPGCGEPDAGRARLDAEPESTGWPDLLRVVTSGEPNPDTPSGPVPTMRISAGEDDDGAADADVHWTPTSAGVTVRWNPTVHPDPSVEIIVGHLGQLVGQLVSAEPPPLARVDILTPAERTRNGGTPTELPHYPPVTLHQLFMLQAWRTPLAPALICAGDTLTYRDLDRASNELAHRLVEAGVQPGDVVAVGGDRCPGLFTALLAVLKAGGVFVHLDPVHPEQRLRQFVEVSRPRLLLNGPGATPVDAGVPALTFPAVPDLTGPVRGAPEVPVGPESPAYILFTSGSTGVPKGVLRPHRLHTSRVFLEQGLYRLGPDDRHLLKLPISAREFFWPLATGGAAVIAEPGGERDDRHLVDLIRRTGISVISCVPSMLQILVANPDFARCGSLRHIFVGGEALHRALEDRVRALGYEVHNTYTLTEADYVTHRSGPLDATGQDDGSVMGVPLDMRVYLCDEHGRLVPPGLVGEVLTGGPGLAAGYYRDPERTAERFVPNPFGDPQAPMLFRSGDLARHLPDGNLEYQGRRDLQVKIRGQRVEPTEVENWLQEHPAVAAAAVVGYPDREQGAVLVAFVVGADGGPTERELREHLTRRLPAYMVPRHFAPVPRLPQLASGKVDRAALKLPDRVRPPELPPSVPARTPVQERLLALWRRVLQLDDVGVDDDYVALGGDSLRLLLLRAAIQDELDVVVHAVDLLGAPTVRAQERLLHPPARTVGTGSDPAPGSVPPRGPAAAAGERARRAALRGAAARADDGQEADR